MSTATQILLYSLGYLGLILADIFFFVSMRWEVLPFLPLMLGVLAVIIVSPQASFGIILIYVCFDGMLKVLSGYHPIIHVGADLLVVTMFLKFLAGIFVGQYRELDRPPFLTLLIAHVAWVAVEILNPYGAGVLAGIASYKFYLSFVSLFFFSFVFVKNVAEVHSLMWVAVAILMIEILFGTYQFNGGVGALTNLSPNYLRELRGPQFTGEYFRPFGTSNVPGGASTFVFLTVPLLVVLMINYKNLVYRGILLGMLSLSGYLLFISQVRSAVLKGFGGLAFMSVLLFWRQPIKLLLSFSIVTSVWFAMHNYLGSSDPALSQASKRLASLQNIETIAKARGGLGFIDRMIEIISLSPFGIGLSRTGGAGGIFYSNHDKNLFDASWNFADNLYLALIIELGIPGTILFMFLIFLPFFKLLSSFGYASRYELTKYTIAGGAALYFASIMGHYGSQGCLALPESAYTWLFLGCCSKLAWLSEHGSPDEVG